MRRRAENELRAAFRAMGAVSPATARPGKHLTVDKAAFDNLFRRRVIREGAPGAYYLYEPQKGPDNIVINLLAWVAVTLLSMGVMKLCSQAP